MSDMLERLREIGAEEIHEKTHISIHSIKAILDERFADISHIQYNGFLNIMEDNLHMDLAQLRERYHDYRVETGQDVDNRVLFVKVPDAEKNHKPMFISLASIIFIAIIFFTFPSENESENFETQTASAAIEAAKKNISLKEEANTTNSAVQSLVKKEDTTHVASFDQEQVKDEIAAEDRPFVLYPKEALWIGVVNIDTDEQMDTITSDPFPLDENANLLISLGHGYVKVALNGEIDNLSDRGRVRFLYKNGQLSRISLGKFKELNKGKSW